VRPEELDPEAREKLAELLRQFEWSHLDLVSGADPQAAQASGTIAE